MCRVRLTLAIAAVVLIPTATVACLWDYDTIKMERTRFPTTLELITGKFLRHSTEFYEWRIRDRLKKLEADPKNAGYLDDLAVAYDKTGQHDKAIETMQKQEKVNPGRYETAANLGTFYFHSGKLEEGIPHIDRALAINPDAHFGREKYQKLLVQYVIERRAGGALKLPMTRLEFPTGKRLEDAGRYDFTIHDTFAQFLRKGSTSALPREEREAAVKGVLGMMKFGKHDAPVLLEALGSVLVDEGYDVQHDAKLLAARAYLKASYEVPDGPARKGYRLLADRALDMQTRARDSQEQIQLGQVEAEFQKELAEAREWYADLRERELSWIRDGKDPEAEFDKLYEPEVSGMDAKDPMSAETWDYIRFGAMGVGAILALVAVALLGYRVYRRIRRAASV